MILKKIQGPQHISAYGKTILILLLCVMVVPSCTKKFDEYNTNPYLASLEQQDADSYATGKNFPAMINAVMPAGDPAGRTDFVNSYQTAYNLAGDVYSGFMGQAGDWNANTNNLTYGFVTAWLNEQFNLTGKLMAGWKNVKDATAVSGDSLQFSVAQIIKVVGIIRATDSYGPVPYTSIPTGSFTPYYDRQDSIYYSAFADLKRARDILYKLGAAAGTPLQLYDLIYAGDYLKWARFANSLVLRLAIRITYADPANAKLMAEEAVGNAAGTITAAADNAWYSIKAGNGQFNFSNPLRTLTQDYLEARMSAPMQSILTGYNDPRIAAYFKTSTLTGHTTEYVGIRSGINVTRSLYQPFSQLNVTDATPLPWMLASEVNFLKAEGALRGWNMGGTAQQFYQAGIAASFTEQGATLPAAYTTDNTSKPKNYTDFAASANSANAVSTITIQWDNAANFETSLERIITQKWIALYPNGQEAWSEFRRTGYPKLFPIVLDRSGGTVDKTKQVRRLPYPLAQYQQNGTQVSKALTLLGGADNGNTRLWWDKKP